MTHAQLSSKVLIHETERAAGERIKAFCDAHHLIGIKGQDQHVMDALRANIDLGGVFLCASDSGLRLGRQIHALRPELPLFLRLPQQAAPGTGAELATASYRAEEIDTLKQAIDRYIFNRHFPAELVRGITEITLESLRSQFRDVEVGCETPYLVNDRLIYGQMFSIMPLETGWCRGYMMLQADEAAIEQAIRLNRTLLPADPSAFRQVSAVLGEVSNLVWGGIRGRFGNGGAGQEISRSQVPILINQQEKYISFGAGDPQLCFHYSLRDSRGDSAPIELYQKFIFNLSWTPEHFETARPVDDYVDSGELELF